MSKGAYVTTSRDTHQACRVIKRAVISGLNSTGVNVRDLTTATAAINRFDVKGGNAAGAIHVQMSLDNPEQMEILFSEPPGVPVDTRRERADREPLLPRGLPASSVRGDGPGGLPAPSRSRPTRGALLENWDTVAIRRRQPRLVVDFSSSAPAFFFSGDSWTSSGWRPSP